MASWTHSPSLPHSRTSLIFAHLLPRPRFLYLVNYRFYLASLEHLSNANLKSYRSQTNFQTYARKKFLLNAVMQNPLLFCFGVFTATITTPKSLRVCAPDSTEFYRSTSGPQLKDYLLRNSLSVCASRDCNVSLFSLI